MRGAAAILKARSVSSRRLRRALVDGVGLPVTASATLPNSSLIFAAEKRRFRSLGLLSLAALLALPVPRGLPLLFVPLLVGAVGFVVGKIDLCFCLRLAFDFGLDRFPSKLARRLLRGR
jgi:hypothetical protein